MKKIIEEYYEKHNIELTSAQFHDLILDKIEKAGGVNTD